MVFYLVAIIQINFILVIRFEQYMSKSFSIWLNSKYLDVTKVIFFVLFLSLKKLMYRCVF